MHTKYFVVSKIVQKVVINVTLKQKCLLNVYEVKQVTTNKMLRII